MVCFSANTSISLIVFSIYIFLVNKLDGMDLDEYRLIEQYLNDKAYNKDSKKYKQFGICNKGFNSNVYKVFYVKG